MKRNKKKLKPKFFAMLKVRSFLICRKNEKNYIVVK